MGGSWGGGGTKKEFGHINWSDLAGDDGGGMGGRRGEVAHGGAGKGEMGGGHPRAVQKVHWLAAPLINLTTCLILAVTRVEDGGRRGEVAHGGRARGRWGGAPESSVGATKNAWFPLLNNWSDLAGDEGGGMGGGVGRWPMEGGPGVGIGGGHQRAVWGATTGFPTPSPPLPALHVATSPRLPPSPHPRHQPDQLLGF